MKTRTKKCRVCLIANRSLRDITEPIDSFDIRDAFLETTNIFVSDSDPARLICVPCVDRLKVALAFRKQSLASDFEIRRLTVEGLWEVENLIKEEQNESFDDAVEENSDFNETEMVPEVKIETLERPKWTHEFSQTQHPIDSSMVKFLTSRKYKRVGRLDQKRYVCEECGFETPVKYRMSAHIQKEHLPVEARLKKTPKTDSLWVKKQLARGRTLTCDFCLEKFRLFSILHKHIRKEHMSTTPFGCSFPGCVQNFKTVGQRDAHYNRVHEGTRVVCEVCGKNVKKTGMKDHLNSHRTDRPFKCPFEGCGDAFKDKNCLTQHINCRHSDVKKYGCHVCGNNFKLSTSLQAHIRRMHTFKNCLQCELCQKWCLNANELQLHMNKIHLGLRPFVCDYCDATFKARFHINRHLRISHPNEFAVLLQTGQLKIRKTSKYSKFPDSQTFQPRP